jgi:hypothetical protein
LDDDLSLGLSPLKYEIEGKCTPILQQFSKIHAVYDVTDRFDSEG